MDWYFGSGIDDLVVPKYQELSDRLPSPDSWSKWGIREPESFRSPNKCFIMDANLAQQQLNHYGKSMRNEVELDAFHDKDHSCSSSICEGFSEESFQQRALSRGWPACQLNDLAGFEQMNDIFLSSLIEDLPEAESADGSFYFSPESKCDMMQIDNLDSQSMWNDANNTTGNSKYLKRHALSPLVGWDNRDLTAVQFIPCHLDQIDQPPVKGPFGEDTVSSEQISTNGNLGQETSPEESVLQELEMAMTQLTEKTRICFRDSLYRLAKNSKQHHLATQKQDIHLAMEKAPPWTAPDTTTRSESKKAMESETNVVDRAVANLMFNEIDFSGREFSSAASVNSDEGVTGDTQPPVISKPKVVKAIGPPNYSLNQSKIQQVSHQPILPGDAEVPTLAQRDP
ncbi:protein LNK3 isoform X1 [Alnus glutinosa]|uniref:protein LNK3 isoform X1 n=1 Tax=Alnus glutinosa TaxID=3517 RepID=UPI002D76DCEC|nr:protein LNK3 isoform X1 [Alnus glutinosa]